MFIGMTVKEAIAKLEEKGWDYFTDCYEDGEIFSITYNTIAKDINEYTDGNTDLYFDNDICEEECEVFFD